MEVKKWDGITDADKILKALLFFINDDDKKIALTMSYGDFGIYLQKKYKNQGKGNGGDHLVFGWAQKVQITLCKQNIRYDLTWNKAAKLIHKHLKGA